MARSRKPIWRRRRACCRNLTQMAKFPEPPTRLTLPAEMHTLSKGTRCWRIYFAGGAHPSTWDGYRSFGPTAARFDHHDDPPGIPSKAILYAALRPIICLAEVFQATRVIDRATRQPWLAGFELARDLDLLDLSRTWPTRAGASMAINTGPRPRARRWSRLIYDSYEAALGIYYPSSMCGNSPSMALFERSRHAMPAAPIFNRALADPALLRRLATAATELGYKLV